MSVSAASAPSFDQYAEFGPSIASVDVEDAVISTLQTWLPTYLRQVATDRNLGFRLAVPKDANYANVIVDTAWPDVGLPAILVATAHVVTGSERVASDDSYEATWLTAVSAVVRGRKPAETRRVASLYELAIRMALVQHPSLLGFADGVRWVGGGEARPLLDPAKEGRYLGEGASQFHVLTSGNVQGGTGPRVPLAAYESPLPEVQAFKIDVTVGAEEAEDVPDDDDPSGG